VTFCRFLSCSDAAFERNFTTVLPESALVDLYNRFAGDWRMVDVDLLISERFTKMLSALSLWPSFAVSHGVFDVIVVLLDDAKIAQSYFSDH
jgi:hypothetical protein